MDQDIYINLFNKIKNHKYDDFKNILLKNEDIDVNIRDEHNEYLLNYAILYNNLDIIKLLYEKGAKIDILDNDERSILFTCIKYNYDKTIKYLVEKNNENIGINILYIYIYII
jgi:ankyrin repeat protein